MADVDERRIVVGVDGSEESRAALRWAVRQARLTGAVVEAMVVWKYPSTFSYDTPFTDADFAAWAQESLTGCVEDALLAGPPVEVRQTVEHGDAAKALLEAARDADLLVVGNHGHGALTAALLRSVARECAHRANCPVVLVCRQKQGQGEVGDLP
jgi:nucleotide-binding universal stress UspA family protein